MSESFEVENKFRVESFGPLRERLVQLDVAWSAPIEQVDTYFAHPCRDFAVTDEALRIRKVQDDHWVTYKGPKIDQVTKTRRELELPLGNTPQTTEQFGELFAALGFQAVAQVYKQRTIGRCRWQHFDLELALDQIDGIGSFVELEIVTDDAGLDAAQGAVLQLAEHLDLAAPVRASYLELVLASRQSDDDTPPPH